VKGKRKFTVLIERDEEGYYVATVPGLPGCHTQAKKKRLSFVWKPIAAALLPQRLLVFNRSTYEPEAGVAIAHLVSEELLQTYALLTQLRAPMLPAILSPLLN
jgi:hypothetical protein